MIIKKKKLIKNGEGQTNHCYNCRGLKKNNGIYTCDGDSYSLDKCAQQNDTEILEYLFEPCGDCKLIEGSNTDFQLF